MDTLHMHTRFDAPISQEIWEKKYRLVRPNNIIVDETVEDSWHRVATFLASAEATQNQSYWADQFYSALENFRFLPAGRILSGAGTGRNVTLFNCYVMGTIPDSMEGIFDMLKEAALTMQQGGGIGYDFSTIRPKNSPVKGVEADASGPLSFMDCWDAMCRTIMSAGARRGAMMATMRCDHPDIEDFITAKHDSSKLRMFNVSVLITDAFMDAVRQNTDWPLQFNGHIHKWVCARDLWNKIMKSTYDYAEPGVIFIDRINQQNNLNYCETISATNPCGEQPLPPYGACLLGSINLARLVTNPFSRNAIIRERELRDLVSLAVRMLDNVNDLSNFPLTEQLAQAKSKRRIGLGMTGLADALMMLNIRYGSQEAADMAEKLMNIIDSQAYLTSAYLAAEKEPFPHFNADSFLAPGTHASTLSDNLQLRIRELGIRNSHLTSIAPTGTISLYAGNVSSGCEPVFAASYDRRVLDKNGNETWQTVKDYAVAKWHEMGKEGLPPAYVDAQTLTPSEHILMQSALQKHVDSSISKTVNLPKDISFEDFKAVYQSAYDKGCKGCTTYRPNDVTGSVLKLDDAPQESQEEQPAPSTPDTQEPAPADIPARPEVLFGSTYKLKWPMSEHAFYVTISDIIDKQGPRPFEIFINSKSMEHYQWIVGLTRMISAVFRRGGDVDFVAEELKAVFDPRGGAWQNGKYVPSLLAAIGAIIEQHLRSIDFADFEMTDADLASLAEWERTSGPPTKSCSKCGGFNIIEQGGCPTCADCGDSKCG